MLINLLTNSKFFQIGNYSYTTTYFLLKLLIFLRKTVKNLFIEEKHYSGKVP